MELSHRHLRVLIILLTAGVLFGCRNRDGQEAEQVVIYTSLDKIFSEPILKAFTEQTGIAALAVYDSEATKTTGLVNRLIAEKNSPRADVFWNSETGRTIVLKRKDVLAPYVSPSSADIPDQFKDTDGFWTGFAARCRILIYNKNLISADEAPESVFALTGPKWKGKLAMAYPLFGTTATHCAAWFAHQGEEQAKAYLAGLKANEVMITDGNASARDRVVDGTVPLGFTDTDDAFVAIHQGYPVDIIWPDQEGIGTLLIPNTVALVKGGPHPEPGKKLIDFLLSPQVETMLAHAESGQIPLRHDIERPAYVPSLHQIKAMDVDYEQIADWMEPSGKYLQSLFVR